MNEQAYREAERRLWDSVGLDPVEEFVTLPDLSTQVRIQSFGSGPPVVFIHGGPNSGSTWAPLVEHLEGFHCFLLDRPGTGLSEAYEWSTDAVVPFASELVPQTLDALDLDSAHVVASSFGGYCALWGAAESPERFERMVQMACPALLPGQQPPQFMKLVMFPGLRHIIAALPPNKNVQASIMRQIGHGKSLDADRLPEEHMQWYESLLRYTDTQRNDFELLYSIKGGDGFDASVTLGAETLARVECPTHFIWGADDGFGGAEVARWVVDAMPSASLELIEDSGHLPWLDAPEHVASETAAFLRGNGVVA